MIPAFVDFAQIISRRDEQISRQSFETFNEEQKGDAKIIAENWKLLIRKANFKFYSKIKTEKASSFKFLLRL